MNYVYRSENIPGNLHDLKHALNEQGGWLHGWEVVVIDRTSNYTVAILRKPLFEATHRHAEGNLYQVLDTTVKVHIDSTWVPAVRYCNAEGIEFVRTRMEFDARMVPL